MTAHGDSRRGSTVIAPRPGLMSSTALYPPWSVLACARPVHRNTLAVSLTAPLSNGSRPNPGGLRRLDPDERGATWLVEFIRICDSLG